MSHSEAIDFDSTSVMKLLSSPNRHYELHPSPGASSHNQHNNHHQHHQHHPQQRLPAHIRHPFEGQSFHNRAYQEPSQLSAPRSHPPWHQPQYNPQLHHHHLHEQQHQRHVSSLSGTMSSTVCKQPVELRCPRGLNYKRYTSNSSNKDIKHGVDDVTTTKCDERSNSRSNGCNIPNVRDGDGDLREHSCSMRKLSDGGDLKDM